MRNWTYLYMEFEQHDLKWIVVVIIPQDCEYFFFPTHNWTRIETLRDGKNRFSLIHLFKCIQFCYLHCLLEHCHCHILLCAIEYIYMQFAQHKLSLLLFHRCFEKQENRVLLFFFKVTNEATRVMIHRSCEGNLPSYERKT